MYFYFKASQVLALPASMAPFPATFLLPVVRQPHSPHTGIPPSQTHLACLHHRLLVLYGVREIEMFWDDGMHKLQATYPLFTS